MLVAVDGTGPWFDDTYAKEMFGSFVSKIYNESPESGANKHYRRGPTLLGFETGPIAYDFAGIILKKFEESKKAGTDFKLFLTGYSRGAASVIGIAYLLQQYQPEIKIEFMALFDAVDRSPIVTADSITNNVKMCYHAIRDPNAGSRTYFGNCGLTIDSPGIMVKRIFFATHAGMGGIPWTGDHPTKKISNPRFDTAKWVQQNRFNPRDVLPPPDAFIEVPLITEDQDKAGSGEVQKWMWDAMKKYGMLK
jgi:hypothetical protein